MMKFYVYALYSPDGYPFYIGKGSGRRIDDHFRKPSLSTNSHKNNKIISLLKTSGFVKSEILSWHENEKDAYEMEGFLIHYYGLISDGGILTNIMRNNLDIPDSVRKLVVRRHEKSRINDNVVVDLHSKYISGELSLQHCADVLGVSKPYLSQIFDGKRKPHLQLSSKHVGRSKRYDEETKLRVFEMKTSGLTFKEVSELTGIPFTSITHMYYRQSTANKANS